MAGEITRTTTVPAASAHILADDEFDRVWRMSKALAASGMFKDVTQAEQAFGRILLGRDLGLTPTQALMSVDVVEGNVQVRAVRLAAWVRQHPDYDYTIQEHDDQHCVINFWRVAGGGSSDGVAEQLGVSSFSMEDAEKARLIKDHPKSPWRAHPRNMLFARAMSNGVKWYCPDVTGGIPVYAEADVFVDSTATEISTGEGDGSAPGWAVDEDLVDALDDVLTRAEKLAFPGLGDKATTQLRLNGQSRETVEEWLAAAREQLSMLEDNGDA